MDYNIMKIILLFSFIQCIHSNNMCPRNEYYSQCGANSCQNTCENPEISTVCRGPCVPGCVCNNGYLRNYDGSCVQQSACSCKDANAIFVPNPTPCPPSCSIPNPICTLQSTKAFGCQCKPEYILNNAGVCIPNNQCPPTLTCKANEVFIFCPNICPRELSCDDFFRGLSVFCTNPSVRPPCRPACVCNNGFVRNSNNICVQPSLCCSDPNAILIERPPACPPSCSIPNPISCTRPQLLYGCACKPGFILNNAGICVPYEQCPPTFNCATNEVFIFCPGNCPRESQCLDYFNGVSVPCQATPPILPCNPACRCSPGYIRNANNQCVLPPLCCDDVNAEIVANSSACKPTCANPNPTACATPPARFGCECKPGYILNAARRCIPYNQCPPTIECKPNEVYLFCPGYCPRERRCIDYFNAVSVSCLNSPPILPCNPACRCAPGYIRNSNNVCIQPNMCCSDVNSQVLPNTSPCQPTCSNPNPGTCARPPMAFGCQCRPGYILNSNRVCVPYIQCPPTLTCTAEEEYVFCPNSCVQEITCLGYFNGLNLVCSNPSNILPCQPICKCKSGLVRNESGKCVQPPQCCQDSNSELVANPIRCPPTCSNPNPRPCTLPQLAYGCRCKAGYILNNAGICIPYNQCPPTITCRPNEVFIFCPGTCSREPQCVDYFNGNAVSCLAVPPVLPCTPACRCAPGYIRNSNNICVLPAACCNDANAVVVPNTSPCLPTCANPNPITCTRPPQPFGCQCKPGYILNAASICVPYIQCPPTIVCSQSEIFIFCPNTCPREITCDDYFNGGNGNCVSTGDPAICRPVCKCRDGLVRNSRGICVQPPQCCADVNSELIQNPPPCAPTCANPNPRTCTRPQLAYGCVCKQGFILNSVGVCIPYNQCPPTLSCNANEVYIFCPGTCAREQQCVDYFNGNTVACLIAPPVLPCTPVCRCAPGYIRNTNNVCVLPNSCCSDVNSAVVPNTSPCQPTCSNPNPGPCSRPPQPFGCRCKPGYILNSALICVPYDQCPPILPCKPTETFVFCPTLCPREITCDSYFSGNDGTCVNPSGPISCTPACKCRLGLVRNPRGDCIPPPQCCADPNSELIQTPPKCPPTCSNPNPQSCTLPQLAYGCRCKAGFILNNAGICIPYNQCPPTITCNPNEIFIFCPGTCSRERQCIDYFNGNAVSCLTVPPILPCVPVCRCAPGYIRNANNVCVLPNLCCSDLNAQVASNVSPCQPTCANPNPGVCTRPIQPYGCQCRPGYILNAQRVCVPYNQCPPILTCTQDEEFIFCPNPCPREVSCSDYMSGGPGVCVNPTNDSPCEPKCRCKNGLVRNASGRCVQPPMCCTDPNSSLIQNPPKCPPTCSNPNPLRCTNPQLVYDCRCRPGYIFNNAGVCIPYNQCPPTITCPQNEVFLFCPGRCPREQQCIDYFNGNTVSCLITPPSLPCAPVCRCAPGYIRNSNNICVLPASCCDDANAVVVPNTSPCRPTCSNPNPSTCPRPPQPFGCQCKPGFILNAASVCVPYVQCPPTLPCNAATEDYIFCPSTCPREITCRDYFNGDNGVCINPTINLPCIPICKCKNGLVRNANGVCVQPPQCCSDVNSQLIQNPPPCRPTCSNPNPGSCTRPQLAYGCVCKEGYILNNADVCVPYNQCPPTITCNANEVYIFCPGTCVNEQRCSDYYNGSTANCQLVPPVLPCVPVCRCAPGYIRNSLNVCVQPSMCCSDPNAEIVPSATTCRPTCSNPNPTPCTTPPLPFGCRCRAGYILNSAGRCIPYNQCPPTITCNANEVYIFCPGTCVNEQRCSDYYNGRTANCQLAPPVLPCVPVCRCAPGYIRNSFNVCVQPSMCCSDPNAEIVPSATTCRPTCSNPNPTPCTTPPLRFGCRCRAGYILNSAGRCIPYNQCPPTITCNANEVYIFCPGTCVNEQRCSDYYNGRTANCQLAPPVLPCVPVCRCAPGYIRNSLNVCVQPSMCCSDPNAEIVPSATTCRPTCSNPNPTPCTTPPLPFGCRCRAGYILNGAGRCIPYNQCPPTITCNVNEVYIFCPGTCVNEQRCSDYYNGRTANCQLAPPVLPCIPVCRCAPGYIRNSLNVCVQPSTCCSDPNAEIVQNATTCRPTCSNPNPPSCTTPPLPFGCRCRVGYILNSAGRCVPYNQCPPTITCNPNEIYIFCPGTCVNEQRCSDYYNGRTANCQLAPPVLPCVPVCRCAPGYIRNSLNVCVRPSMCCSDPNAEIVASATTCRPTCSNPNPTPCTTPPLSFGCRCRAGYILNSAGRCIPYNQCPPTITCNANEVYIFCPGTCVNEQRCSDYYNGRTANCQLAPPVLPCVPVCRCAPGYIRNSLNICVQPSMCCSDPNAEIVPSATTCRPTCSNPNPTPCTTPPLRFGCRCRAGYILNSAGRCIPYNQCSPTITCNANEVYIFCPGTCVNEQRCSDYYNGRTANCQLAPPVLPCVPVCRCAPGYIRNSLNVCVQPSMCCSDANAQVVPNATTCRPTCSNPNPTPCSTPPLPFGCICKPGYILNNAGICVPYNQCPPTITCNPNEVFIFCPGVCVNEQRCTDYYNGRTSNCQLAPPVLPCAPVCRCAPGYIRNARNVCVQPSLCCSDSNAVVVQNATTCRPTCSNPNPTNCTTPPLPFGCICRPGYILNNDGICVPYNQCPPTITCNPNEVYIFCPGTCVNEQRCSDYYNGRTANCQLAPPVLPCSPVCRCAPGYIRNARNVCVQPSMCCSDSNAEVIQNATTCRPTCLNPNPTTCRTPPLPFGCRCKNGYILNAQAVCIPYAQCPPTLQCKSGEEFEFCPGAIYESTCDDYFNSTVINPSPIPPICKPVCKCVNGCYRKQNKQCVLPQSCCADENAEVVSCMNRCPGGTCARHEFVKCRIPCSGIGCQCKNGYVKRNNRDPTCVSISQCY